MIPSDFEPSASATREPALITRLMLVIQPVIASLQRAKVYGPHEVPIVPSASTGGHETVGFDTLDIHVRPVMQQGHHAPAADRRFPVAG